jgi:hypothetical protein
MQAPNEPERPAVELPSGVDSTLVAWMLSLSPAERLAALQGQVDSILRLRNARVVAKVP